LQVEVVQALVSGKPKMRRAVHTRGCGWGGWSERRTFFFSTQTFDLSSFPSFHILQKLWARTVGPSFGGKKRIVSAEFLHVASAFGDRESTVVRGSLIGPLLMRKPIFSGRDSLPTENVYRQRGFTMCKW